MPTAPTGSMVLAWHSPPAPKPCAPLGSMTVTTRRWHLISFHRDPGTKAHYSSSPWSPTVQGGLPRLATSAAVRVLMPGDCCLEHPGQFTQLPTVHQHERAGLTALSSWAEPMLAMEGTGGGREN